jgi:hypothetical protein
LYPGDTASAPNASTVNYSSGVAVANDTIVRLSAPRRYYQLTDRVRHASDDDTFVVTGSGRMVDSLQELTV